MKLTAFSKIESTNYSKAQKIVSSLETVILGKSLEVRQALSCILAGGHLLIEDMPGLGKSTLVKALGKVLGLETNRVQFTNDLLPADIVGSFILNRDSGSFEFRHGPIFTQLLFADELNRATPKTQSACLQAMEEKEITVEGATYQLPTPFVVVATQNPRQSIGTFPLPESQLDRFLFRMKLGFPSREAERLLLKGKDPKDTVEKLNPIVSRDELIGLQLHIQSIHISESILDYIQDLVEKSRQITNGLSPRGAMSMQRAAKAWAFLQGRDFVTPDDLQSIAPLAMNHRLGLVDQDIDVGLELVGKIISETVIRE